MYNDFWLPVRTEIISHNVLCTAWQDNAAASVMVHEHAGTPSRSLGTGVVVFVVHFSIYDSFVL